LKVIDGRQLDAHEIKVTNPVKLQILTNLALVYARQSNYSKVIEVTSDALTIDPNHVKSLYKRGEAYHRTV
jgi:tetratricopeptide (TPR) repeat protein